MKLVRYGPPGRERPGIWMERGPDGRSPCILDVRASAFDVSDYDSFFFSRWGLARLRALLEEPPRTCVDPEGVRLGPPIARPGKILCLGKNYADHAREFGGDLPDRPVVFAKAPSAIVGPSDDVYLPPGARVVDGEVELALVIGARAQAVSEQDALDHVAGYMVLNDITDREAQRAGNQWFYGKGADSFCPMGPYLATADEVGAPDRLELVGSASGRVLQRGRTRDMHFNPQQLIAFISQRVTLEPGDVISTGTPGGIGSARDPRVLLSPGEVAEAEVTGLGRQRNPVRMREGTSGADR